MKTKKTPGTTTTFTETTTTTITVEPKLIIELLRTHFDMPTGIVRFVTTDEYASLVGAEIVVTKIEERTI